MMIGEKSVSFAKSDALRPKFHATIPGGAHTYAKGDDQFPEGCSPFLVRGSGCHVWDADDNEFIEYGMGLRAVTLGHANQRVNETVYRQMKLGSNFSRPATIELQCAEELQRLVAGAEMVKFGKNGSDATNAAIKLARAYTGRDLVAICADHPFFSVDDWFIATTPMNAGIPKTARELTVQFRYNDLASVQALFTAYPDRIACLIMEPEKGEDPRDRFLHRVQELCRQNGAVFILDEMITGFRWHAGGGQAYHKIVADLSTFGKAMGNGFSISALVGRREIMRLGGIDHDRERVFLLSLTHGAENHCLAAAFEVMRIYQEEPVIATLWRQGNRLQTGIDRVVAAHGMEEYFKVAGKPCCLTFATLDANRKPSQDFRTLFLQETIRRGVLAPSFIVSYAHTDADIDRTIEVVDAALAVYAQALDTGVEKFLVG
ncbi:MAG TPA: glutamate-1-semialdehyde 2,1-aminomutase, partial [Chthoniobacterales bacterium]|nr:glutamate-1-semialdehyde 2,1-aminomutase [Chthoniobacterales bacterium]